MPEPWRTTCDKLAEHDPKDRYKSADEALSDTFQRFAAAGIRLGHFHTHAQKMSNRPLIPGWA